MVDTRPVGANWKNNFVIDDCCGAPGNPGVFLCFCFWNIFLFAMVFVDRK